MIPRPPRSTRTDSRVPYAPLFRSQLLRRRLPDALPGGLRGGGGQQLRRRPPGRRLRRLLRAGLPPAHHAAAGGIAGRALLLPARRQGGQRDQTVQRDLLSNRRVRRSMPGVELPHIDRKSEGPGKGRTVRVERGGARAVETRKRKKYKQKDQ